MICENIEECLDKQIEGQSIKVCVNNKAECIEVSDCRSKVKCEERKKKYILENTQKNHVILYKIDGGVILEDKTVPSEVCKCDYLFVINGEECDAILTELKGVDVAHSLKQIDGTLVRFKKFFSRFSHVYVRIIVRASTPNIKASPNYVNLVRKIRNSYCGNLKIAEMQLSEKDINLLKESALK